MTRAAGSALIVSGCQGGIGVFQCFLRVVSTSSASTPPGTSTRPVATLQNTAPP